MFAVIDLFFIILILVFSLIAAVRGLIKELFSKAALAGGLLAAVFFTSYLLPYMQTIVKNRIIARIFSFLVVFITVFLIIKILQEIVSTVFSGEILQGLDRILGFFFGVAEGLIVTAFILLVLINQPWFDVSGLLYGSFFYSLLSGLLRSPAGRFNGMAA